MSDSRAEDIVLISEGPPPVVEWWRKPLYYTFKILPLIVLVVLVWNFITVTNAKLAELRAKEAKASATTPASP